MTELASQTAWRKTVQLVMLLVGQTLVPALQILHEKLGFKTFKVTSCLTGADKMLLGTGMHIKPH